MTKLDTKTKKALRAFAIWVQVYDKVNGFYELHEFAAFLGDPHHSGRIPIVNTDNPEVMEKIEKILGPHGRTVIKMIEVRNGS